MSKPSEQEVIDSVRALSNPSLKCIAYMLDKTLEGIAFKDTLTSSDEEVGLDLSDIDNLKNAIITNRIYSVAFREGKIRGVVKEIK